MAKSLVIVESPGKVKTINKYLGRDFKVVASMGHVRDLPEKGGGLGVSIEDHFEPQYQLLSEKRKTVKQLKKVDAADQAGVYDEKTDNGSGLPPTTIEHDR